MTSLNSLVLRKIFLVFIFFLPLLFLFLFYLNDADAADATVSTPPVNCGNIFKTPSSTDTDRSPHWGSICHFDEPIHCAAAAGDGTTTGSVKYQCQLTSFPQLACPEGCVAAITKPYEEVPSCSGRQRQFEGAIQTGSVASCTASCKIKCVPKVRLLA